MCKMGPSKWILDKISLFILKVSSHIRQEFIERRNRDALLSRLWVCVWGGGVVCVCVLSHVQLSVTLWTIAFQVALDMGFSKQKYWSGVPFPSPGIFPTQGSNQSLLHLLHWQMDYLPVVPNSNPLESNFFTYIKNLKMFLLLDKLLGH